MPAFSAPTLANPFCRAIRRPPTWVSRSPASSVAATPAPGGGANRRQAARATRIRSIPCVRSLPALLTPATPMTVPPNHSADPRSCTACATTWLSVLPMLSSGRRSAGWSATARLPRGSGRANGPSRRSDRTDLVGLRAAIAGAGGELDPLALVEGPVAAVVGDRREVHEDVVPAVVGLD